MLVSEHIWDKNKNEDMSKRKPGPESVMMLVLKKIDLQIL